MSSLVLELSLLYPDKLARGYHEHISEEPSLLQIDRFHKLDFTSWQVQIRSN